MGWRLEQMKDGKWLWCVYQSAYGAAGGITDTEVEAKVEMIIGEAEIMESPYPPKLVKRWRSDYGAAAVEIGLEP